SLKRSAVAARRPAAARKQVLYGIYDPSELGSGTTESHALIRVILLNRRTKTMDLIEKIRSLPTQPGVYMYKNAAGEVIYVGKAKSLRARVRSYFNEGVGEADAKTGSLLREALDVEYIVVANEKEALALENNLIKQKQPRFNILLRDDK